MESYKRMTRSSTMSNTLELLRKNWKAMTVGGSVLLIIIIIIIAVSVPKTKSTEKISIPEQFRINCHPDKGATKSSCSKRGCIWDSDVSDTIDAPQCYYPPSYGYSIVKETGHGCYELKKIKLPGEEESISKPVEELLLKVEFTESITHLKFTDKSSKRYEVPIRLPVEGPIQMNSTSNNFKFSTENNSTFILSTKSGRRLLNTSIGGFVYNDQFIQIGTYLSGNVLYGFGENPHQSFRHNLTTFKTWPMFARDQSPTATSERAENLYGVHPFCIVLDNEGNAYGLLFWNSNAQEYTTGPGPSLVYRTIGGILDIYVFAGPTPEDVIKQYWSLIGKPALPAYWSLGFQLCRYGYANTSVVQDVMDRMRKMQIPQDVQYVDIDYMDQQADFTIDEKNFKDLPNLVNKTRNNDGIRWVFIVDPALNAVKENYEPFESGKKRDLFIKWPNKELVPELNEKYENTRGTSIMLGTVWPSNNVAFPDFLNTEAHKWWSDQIVAFHKMLPFDGIWIDMNEPANFGTDEAVPWYISVPELKDIPQLLCPNNPLDHPPYPTEAAYVWNASLAEKTLCMIAKQGPYNHYDVHNLYGWSETNSSLKGVQEATKSRGFLLSRSTFPTSGRLTGHWLGDNSATWDDMRISIIGMLEFNLFGIPYVGADICGFLLNTTEELCARWQQLGAFYPFSRNHNGKGDADGMFIEQDPTRWHVVALAARNSLQLRYYYLPYLYTLFYKAHRNADMVVRPLSFVFPTDPKTVDIDRQFMWGPAMLITPCLEPNVAHVKGYFPNALWYGIGEQYAEGLITEQGVQVLKAPLAGPPPVHVRGGFILPRQRPALNTKKSRLNPMELLVTIPLNGGDSVGELYWDDGESIYPANCSYFFTFRFSFNATDLQLHLNKELEPKCEKPPSLANLSMIQFFGTSHQFNLESFNFDGEKIALSNSDVRYDEILNTTTITKDQIISWEKVKESSVLSWEFVS